MAQAVVRPKASLFEHPHRGETHPRQKATDAPSPSRLVKFIVSLSIPSIQFDYFIVSIKKTVVSFNF
jgi:hypothetical protein